MYKTIDPDDVLISEFKTHKSFTFTDADSGSGVYGLNGLSGSMHNFISASAESQSFGTYNALSASNGLPAWSLGTFYKLPTYFLIKNRYYVNTNEPLYNFAKNTNKSYINIHNIANVITVPQTFFGEGIKPGSVKLTDDSTDQTFTIYDDGDGNLYDWRYSSSFAQYKSSSFDSQYWDSNGSGSVIGNVFYNDGLVVITDTGSYSNVGLDTGTNGFELDFKATHTIYEHEITCRTELSDFNATANISATFERSGSIYMPNPVISASNFFPPGDNPTGAGTGSIKETYNPTDTYINNVTHSAFAPYVTTIGLYDNFNQLLAIGKLSKPIRNDPELPLSFVIRFDA